MCTIGREAWETWGTAPPRPLDVARRVPPVLRAGLACGVPLRALRALRRVGGLPVDGAGAPPSEPELRVPLGVHVDEERGLMRLVEVDLDAEKLAPPARGDDLEVEGAVLGALHRHNLVAGGIGGRIYDDHFYPRI